MKYKKSGLIAVPVIIYDGSEEEQLCVAFIWKGKYNGPINVNIPASTEFCSSILREREKRDKHLE